VTTLADPPSAARILALVQSIERHGPCASAGLAFRSALRRAGQEVHATGGLAALDKTLRAIAAVDPDRDDARTVIIRAAWAEVLPGPGMERR